MGTGAATTTGEAACKREFTKSEEETPGLSLRNILSFSLYREIHTANCASVCLLAKRRKKMERKRKREGQKRREDVREEKSEECASKGKRRVSFLV